MNLALFDFDGTITTREVLSTFMKRHYRPRWPRVAKAILWPLYIGCKLGVVPAPLLIGAVARLGLTGVPHAQLEAGGRAYAEHELPALMRAQALERLAWHRAQGDQIVIVSGSLDHYLRHWCAQQGYGLICSSLEHKDGLLTGRYLGKQCLGAEKSRRVRAQYDLRRYPVIYAYGDTREDLAMMALAHRKYYQWQEMAA